MPVMELTPDVSLCGRKRRELEARVVGTIEDSDLALLASERGIKPQRIKRLHDRHHSLARCLAEGLSNNEASAITGYDPSRISILKRDPTFLDLIEHYRKVKDSAYADFQERASLTALQFLNHMTEILEETPEEVSLMQATKVVESLADRTGNAPVSRSIAVGVNVDLGGRLASARRRVESERSEGLQGGERLSSKELEK